MSVALNKRYTDYRVLHALASPTKTEHVIRTPNSTTAYQLSIPAIARLIESGLFFSILHILLFDFGNVKNCVNLWPKLFLISNSFSDDHFHPVNLFSQD